MPRRRSTGRATRLASFLAAASALALAACAATPVVTPPPVVYPNNPTVNITFSCAGVGAAASIGTVPDQVITATIGHPTTPAQGSTFDISVTLSTFSLAAAPSFIDLNSQGLAGTTYLSATNGTVSNAGASPVLFTGNGVTATIPAATASVTAGTGGSSMTVTVGGVGMIVGSTGFSCTPVAPTPSGGTFTIPLA